MTIRLACLIIAGGSAGSLIRFWIGTLIPFSIAEFAWGTFLVNMAGCFAIGCCYPWFQEINMRAFLITGVLGGFTTFSGLGLEIFRYIENNSFRLALLYGLTSLILGTILVWLGNKTGLWVK